VGQLTAAVAALAAAVFAWPTAMPTTAPAPQPTILWDGAPAASFSLDVRPLGVSPDGDARALVRVVLHGRRGAPAHLRRGADFDYFSSRGSVQWQTRLRFGGPAAIVSVRDDGPAAVRVVANRPKELGTQRTAFDTRRWRMPRVVAAAVGPHLVRVGWFPQVRDGDVRVYRAGPRGARALAAVLRAPSSSWDDGGVRPGRVARYEVVMPHGGRSAVHANVPPPLPTSAIAAIRGKSAWLAFSGDPLDDEAFGKLDVDRIVATASRAGLRAIQLRLAYGAFDEVTPAAKATVDRLIDGLAARNIRTIGWTLPRANAFDDLARNVAVASYRTPAGNGISGLAVDLERGEEYFGAGPRGFAALRDYLAVLRRAVGPQVLLIATVEDPFLQHLDESTFPYREIARDADVLQPMTYWRMGPWASAAKASAAVSASVALVRRLAARDVPIGVGAQSAALYERRAPPGDELAAAIGASRRAGAIGVTIFDWNGTGPEQWEALARAAW
jgi:hypothetical protein